MPGDDLPGGVHFGMVAPDGAVVGTCFVYSEPCPWRPDADAWRLRSMATDPAWRGSGVGRAVLSAAVEYARSQGADLLWCNAREPAAGFYERGGFRRHGDVFTDERHTIPHVRMWRELRTGPASS